MTGFRIHNRETASAEATTVLEQAEQRFGFVPNLLGALAEAPVAAEAYLSLSGLLTRASFTPTERHVVWFTINHEHDCQYCMAAHTAMAKREGIADEVIEAARSGQAYADPRLATLSAFTRSLVVQRGNVSPEEVEAFLAAGFSRQHVLEIVAAIAHKVLSNYTNHLVNTPVDDVFAAFTWRKPEAHATPSI